MVDLCAKPFLFDPVSGARVDLPSLATLTRFIPSVERREEEGAAVYLYKEPFFDEDAPGPTTGTWIRDHFIRRLALSSSPLDSNCIVMTLVSGHTLPAYARPGDDSGAEVPSLRAAGLESFRDIIYHDGRFYAVSCAGETVAIDFKDSKSPAHHQDRGHIQRSVEILVPQHPPPHYWEDGLYLVALPSGEIVQVIRSVDDPEDRDSYETEAFEIHKLKVDSEGVEWVEVDCIGDCCMFVGFNKSMSLPAFEVLGKHRTNCIFFTDDIRLSYHGRDYGGLDFGIFGFEEKTVDHFCQMNAQ